MNEFVSSYATIRKMSVIRISVFVISVLQIIDVLYARTSLITETLQSPFTFELDIPVCTGSQGKILVLFSVA
jgi:hypothetical protein